MDSLTGFLILDNMGDEYSIVARKVWRVRALVEASFEYVCSFSEIKVFGKRK